MFNWENTIENQIGNETYVITVSLAEARSDGIEISPLLMDIVFEVS